MGSDDWPPLAVVIPDDIRELDADVAAFHRELRRHARQARRDRLLLRRHWERFGVIAPLLLLTVVVVVLFGGFTASFTARAPTVAGPQDRAQTSVASGLVGGLLPDVDVVVTGNATPIRELRPALLAVLPTGCDCAELVRALVRQTSEYSLRLILVTPRLGRDDASDLRSAALGRATFAVDAPGALARVYGTHALVFVHADGVVTAIDHDPTASERFELPLSQLTTPRR